MNMLLCFNMYQNKIIKFFVSTSLKTLDCRNWHWRLNSQSTKCCYQIIYLDLLLRTVQVWTGLWNGDIWSYLLLSWSSWQLGNFYQSIINATAHHHFDLCTTSTVIGSFIIFKPSLFLYHPEHLPSWRFGINWWS